MIDLLISLAILAVLCGGSVLGRLLLRFLPQRHRSEETMEFTRVASGLLVTFTALVLSLLITNIDAQFAKTEGDLRVYGSTLRRICDGTRHLPSPAHGPRRSRRREITRDPSAMEPSWTRLPWVKCSTTSKGASEPSLPPMILHSARRTSASSTWMPCWIKDWLSSARLTARSRVHSSS